MQALASSGVQSGGVVAFRPTARCSGRHLRLVVVSTYSTDRPPSRNGGSGGGSDTATGTTPRPYTPRPGGGGGSYAPRPGGGGGSYAPRPGGSGGGGNRSSLGGGSYTPRLGAAGGARPYTPRPSGSPYTPRPGGTSRSYHGDSDEERGGRDSFQRGGRGRGPPMRGDPSVPMNENIRAPEVRVLDKDKTPLGVMSTSEALAQARAAGCDLILVVPDAAPPVVRIMDWSKYNYELLKAAKDAKRKQREAVVETKEVKLRPATDVHDYQVKLRNAQKFLSKGQRVKLTLQFRGREMEFQQIGREMFARFFEDCGEEVSMEQQPQMQGRQITMVLGPKKEQQ